MSTYTANYNFEKIDFNFIPWDDKEHNNWDLLDSILKSIISMPNIKGVWQNSTIYHPDDTVLDPASFVWFTCSTDHTSATSGTFAEDRTANPSYWAAVIDAEGAVRYDVAQTLTAGQKTQSTTNINALSLAGGGTVVGNVAATNLTASSTVSAQTLQIDPNFVMGMYGSPSPRITFDNTDALIYDRALNEYQFHTTGTLPLRFTPSAITLGTVLNSGSNFATAADVLCRDVAADRNVTVGGKVTVTGNLAVTGTATFTGAATYNGGITAPFHWVDSFCYLTVVSNQAQLAFDSGDYTAYDRPTDQFLTYIGGNLKYQITNTAFNVYPTFSALGSAIVGTSLAVGTTLTVGNSLTVTAGTAVNGALTVANGITTPSNIGATGVISSAAQVTAPLLLVDGWYFLALNAGNPQLAFDQGDFIGYTRSSNTLDFSISNASALSMSPTAVAISKPLTVEGRRVCGALALATATNDLTLALSDQVSGDLQFTAVGPVLFSSVYVRFNASGSQNDNLVTVQLYDRTAGDVLAGTITRSVSSLAGIPATPFSFSSSWAVTVGKIYFVRLMLKRLTNNAGTVVTQEGRIDAINT